ncbi:MAG TPA: D-amino acid dehydrogenase [Burkholderiaceae bacterium]|nr:D-amino acid dehydrogenase [Burkholderiaceae bacterium]
MHICVIGAGVIGLTSAYFLQSEGHSVTIVEREAAAGRGASAANGAQLSYAFVAPLADASVPPRLPSLFLTRNSPLKLHFRFDTVQWRWAIEFLRHANTRDARRTTAGLLKLAELSREFIEPLIEGEGIHCHFTRGGKLVVYPDARSLASAQAQVLYQAGLGSRQTVLTRAQCVEHEPALEGYAQRIAGGVWTASDAAADCGEFCAQLAQRIVQRGGDLQLNRCASRFDLDGARVRMLQTDKGPLRADAYVLAAGIGAREIALSAGINLPIYPLKGYSITVRPAADAPRLQTSITDARRKVVFAPLGDRVRVAGFIEIGAQGEEIPPARTGALLDAAREVLGYSVIDGDIRPWAGQRPATPSGRPIIGRTPVEHLFLNVGHGALGWTLAAGSARLVCDAIAGRTPTIDVKPYTYQ